MKQLLKFLFLYDPDQYRAENPKGLLLIAVIGWMILSGLIFYHAKDLSFDGKIMLAGLFLWLFIRMIFYRGRYRPRAVYALKIVWLPMAFMLLIAKLTGGL